MARTRRIKRTEEGVAHYHLMSRTNDRRFLFEAGGVKDDMVDALRRTAEFSGVRLRAYTAMDNHFHVVATVTRGDEPVPEGELLRRVGVLKGRRRADELAEYWRDLRAAGWTAKLAEEQDRLRRRMNDVSEFVKTFKEEFDRAYKRRQPYCGSIWSGRFKSTLIEDGEYLATCMRYVVYNPIRAGIVTRAGDYAWSWCEKEAETGVFAGPVPLRRVVQIGEGKVLGSAAFVMKVVFDLGALWSARSVGAHPVEGTACATHGWRLARAG